MIGTWIRMLYLIVSWLFPVAILFQVFLVGLSLFTTQPYWDAHIGFGHSIVLLPALQVLLAYLGKIPPPAKGLTWLLLGICLIQTEVFAMIRTAVPTLAALHPVLALVLFALAMTVAWRARTVVRASAATQPTPGKHTTSGILAGTRETGI
jgi:Family of unknown function (DUF6220)